MGKNVAAAAASFEETLSGLGLRDDELRTPEELGRRAALQAVADIVWTRHLGPLLDLRQVKTLLGVRTRQAVHDLVKRGRMLALPTDGGGSVYPAFQFAPSGRPYAVVAEVIKVFEGADVSEYTIASWFKTRQSAFDGRTPADWMTQGRDRAWLLEIARRAAARLGR